MTTVKQALESLSKDQRKLLMANFNEVEPCTVFLDGGLFLCVHVQQEDSPGEIIQATGYWILGRLRHATA